MMDEEIPMNQSRFRASHAYVNVRLLKIAAFFDLESDLNEDGNPLNADRD